MPDGSGLLLLTLVPLWAAARVAVAQEEVPLGPGALVLRGAVSGSAVGAPGRLDHHRARRGYCCPGVGDPDAFFNGTSEWVDGVYVFPLPDAAAVDELEMTVAGRRIVGEIAERQAARAAYQEARQAGHKATLVEQERPNLFTSSIANIGPGESVQVQIGYWLQPRYEQGSFTLTVPLTLTPRYIPGAALERLCPRARAGRRIRTPGS